MMKSYILLLISVLCLQQAIGSCPSLEQMVSLLPYLSSQNSVCTTDYTCSVLNCMFNVKGNQSSLILRIISCDSIHILANVPSAGVVSWDTYLKDQTEIAIPGFQLPDVSPPLQGYLQVGLGKTGNSSVDLSLVLKGCSTHTNVDNHCPVIKQVLTRHQLPCNSQQKSCSLNVLNGCSEKEACNQISPSSQEGVCVCLQGLVRNSEGTCSPSDSISNDTSPADVQPKVDDSGNNNGSSVVAEILVPVLLLALLTAAIIVLYRHGFFGRLRHHLPSFNRRSTTRFEEMSIGADDDDDPPLP